MLPGKPERYLKFLSLLLKLEGGYSDSPNDRGGKTNFGITQRTYSDYLKRMKRPARSVKEISREEVDDIYFNEYYCKVPHVENELSHYLLFDLAVNSGVGRAKECIREVAPPHSSNDIFSWRRNWYKIIVDNDSTQKSNYQPWLNRLMHIGKVFA